MRLVYLSPVPWSSFAQRPHFMVRHFLRQGFHEVVWVDPYPARLPQMQDFYRTKSLHDQGTVVDSGLIIVKPRFLPIDPLPGGYWLNAHLFHQGFVQNIKKLCSSKKSVLGIGKPTCLAVELATSLPECASFYDAMDDFPHFYKGLSRKSFQRNEAVLAKTVHQIFCSSDALAKKFESSRTKLTLIKNAFDESVVVLHRKKSRSNPPIIGYVGSLGGWFDWKIVCHLASLAPHCEFRLVGPKLTKIPSTLPSNILIFPPCRHEDISHHLSNFDIALIPFVINDLTESVDPVKYYEYRAMGLPIITTRFGQMKFRDRVDGVYFVDYCSNSRIIEDALNFEINENDINSWRSQNTWDHRFQSIVKEVSLR